jgi:hypothetical protein
VLDTGVLISSRKCSGFLAARPGRSCAERIKSPGLIKRILNTRELPSVVKERLIEYVWEKSAGLYGHNPRQVRRFTAALISVETLSGEADGQRNAALGLLGLRRDQLGKGSG